MHFFLCDIYLAVDSSQEETMLPSPFNVGLSIPLTRFSLNNLMICTVTMVDGWIDMFLCLLRAHD